MYQDGILRPNPDGTWSITSVKSLEQGTLSNLRNIGIVQVVSIAAPNAPVSVYLKIKGSEGRCPPWTPARIHQRRTGAQISVNISIDFPPSQGACPAMMYNYLITVPLDVYGLPAGTYSYDVNNEKAGTFTLERDNKFPEDCFYGMNCPW